MQAVAPNVADTVLDTPDEEPPPIPDEERPEKPTMPETPAAMAAESSEPPAAAPPARKTEPLVDEDLGPTGLDPSESGIWFAEGLEAEKQLARKKSGPLPAIYEELVEEEDSDTGIPPWAIIAGVAAAAAMGLFVLLWVYGGDNKATSKKADVVASNDENKSEAPEPPRDESVFAGGDEPETKPEPKQPETKPEPKAKPEPPAKPEPKAPEIKPEPKAPAIKPEPKAPPAKVVPPKPAPKPKRVWARPVPKRRPKPRAKPKKKVVNAKASTEHVKKGQIALRSGQYVKANQEFGKALGFNPRNASAHAGLGESAFERGKFGAAEKHLRKAIRLRPRSQRYLVSLGYACFKQAKYKKAVDQFKKALKVNPRNAEAKSGLNAAVRRLGGTGG